MITVPASFEVDVLRREGEAGHRWLETLPEQVASCCAEWGLALDGQPMHGGLSLIVPVRRGDERAVLKLVWAEADAAQPERRALLLERLDYTRPLSTLPTGEAFQIAGRLLRWLAVPAPAGVPRLADVATELATALPGRWKRAGQPMDGRLVNAACTLAKELGPDADEHLIHTDLHDTNILAGERGSQDEAKPLQWLAIDPRVVAGDPAFAVAPLLWRRVDTMRGPAELAAHLLTLCAAAELDHARVRAWSLVRCLDYWLWGLSVGLTEDPLRCAQVVEWLGWR